MTAPFDATTDFSDIRNLMAESTHVFTGRVESLAGSEALNSFPETQYTVTTGIQLKGELTATVIVNQQGGIRDGIYMSLGGDRPLNVGQWYLFATNTLQSEGWFTLVPVYGDVKVTEQQALDPSSPPLASAVTAIRDNLQGDPPPPSPPQTTR